MGLNFQTQVYYKSPGMSNPDLWALKTTYGRDLPLRRQLQLRIVPVRPTCHWRWDAPMGPKMADPL
jgi:hypothetical protein